MGIAVSVLVPICNVERYLPQCLDSLAVQTLKEIEVICLDDGSTDSSGAIADEYAARFDNFKVVHKPNSGYGHTMNVGLSLARGEYVGIVESDDFASKHMFATLYRVAKRHNLDVAKANYLEYADGKAVLCKEYAGFPYGRVFDPIDVPGVFGATPAIWSGIYRRQMIKAAGIHFVESPGASFQDTGFIYKVWAAAKRCMLLRRGFLRYRIDNAGSSVKSSKKVFALCDEHASVAEFLQTLPADRAEAMARFMQQAKFGTYRWNYGRIAPESHLAFAGRAAEEFRAAQQDGLLDEALFKPSNWALLNELISSPEDFCSKYPEDLPWEF